MSRASTILLELGETDAPLAPISGGTIDTLGKIPDRMLSVVNAKTRARRILKSTDFNKEIEVIDLS